MNNRDGILKIRVGKKGQIMISRVHFTYWRGKQGRRSLYCRLPPRHQLNPSDRPYRRRIAVMLCDSGRERNRCYDEATLFFCKRLIELRKEDLGIKEPYNPLLSDLVEDYWKTNNISFRSPNSMRYWLDIILKKFGQTRARDIAANEIESWWQNELSKEIGDNNMRSVLSVFSTVYNYNKKDIEPRQLRYNPLDGCKRPKRHIRTKLIDTELWKKCYAAAKQVCPELAQFWNACWETGRRPSEISRYTGEMIDWDLKLFKIPKEITKTEDDDKIPMSDTLYNDLLLKSMDRKGLLFKDPKGRQWCPGLWQHYIPKIRDLVGDQQIVLRDTKRGFITRKTEKEHYDAEHVRALVGNKSRDIFNDTYRMKDVTNLRKVVDSNLDSAQLSEEE